MKIKEMYKLENDINCPNLRNYIKEFRSKKSNSKLDLKIIECEDGHYGMIIFWKSEKELKRKEKTPWKSN